jgi:cyanophycinase
LPNGAEANEEGASSRPSRPGPLALVGGDELNPGNEPQDEVLVAAASGGPAYVLATAAARQRPDLAVRNARAWFNRLGLGVDELPAIRRSDVTSAKNAELARIGRFFYLVGGDPGLVPKTLAGTPVWDAIVQAWRDGAALAGSSAGAMALGEWTLIRDRRPGDARRRYRPALSLVPRVAVIPHFDRFGERWVDGALAATPRDDVVLVAVDERSAALWRDGVWQAFGPGAVAVITRSDLRRFAAGKRIEGIPQPAV